MFFFILSKVLSFLSSPFLWILSVLGLSFITKNTQKKKRYVLISFFLIVFFSNNFIFSVAKSTIEIKPIKFQQCQKYKYGIVLGGFAGYSEDVQRIKFHASSDRLWQTIFLYKKHVIEKIVVSGGSGKVFKNTIKEADIVKSYLIDIGIKTEDIIIENQSKNTFENAFFTSKISQINKNKTVLLISSSLHMLRAKKCFEKQGFKVDVFPTNYYSMKDANFFDYILPNSKTLDSWNEFLHEIFGIIAYKITGKI